MWLVKLALFRPYTFIVLAILLFILGIQTLLRTPVDIFPNINIPVVSVVWSYNGLPPDQMANYITGYFERALPTTVNDIEHIESQSFLNVSVTKIFFHKSANINAALSQVTAISQTLLRYLPQGTTPPLVLSYNAATVPVLQLVLSSLTLSEQKLFDLANTFIRTQLAPVEGAALPFPYGGKVRQIQVDLNQRAMQSHNISPQIVNNAINTQNLILPAGTEKIGDFEYFIRLNASPVEVDQLNNLPIKSTNGTLLYIRDVAHVRDGFTPQTNIVRVNGQRAVMMSIQKTGNASTLNIVDGVKNLIPKIKAMMPSALQISFFGDQSIFVKAAITNVIREGTISALLTALMILLFLGNIKNTLIIIISIPLSILASIITLSLLGETINIMTLGGLALAVGILVDDATVAVENINWNLAEKKEIITAILDGAKQISVPALVSTLSICIVFVPIFFLSGVGHYLFLPLGEAVVFAMLMSYLLSRTLVPTLAMYWLKTQKPQTGWLAHYHKKFEFHFDSFRHRYHQSLKKSLQNSKPVILAFIIFSILSFLIITPWIGSNFFPTVDAGQIKLHLRAPTGTRVEQTAKLCYQISHTIKKIIPPNEINSIVENIGLPISGINLSYSNSAATGPQDADILISLKQNHHATSTYVRKLRTILVQKYPGTTFSFLPADIVNQILNFGLPSPIDIQVVGFDTKANIFYAQKILEKIKQIPGIVDARIQQAFNYPQLFVDVDRSLAKQLNFTQLDVAASMLISLSGSFQTTPTFWLSKEGVAYPIVTQTPQYNLDSIDALRNIPLVGEDGQPQILGALSTIERQVTSSVESHYNVQPVIDIFAGVERTDLGSIATKLKKILANTKKLVPKGSSVALRGQIETQSTSYFGLYTGLIFSIILVYFLIVINFQSWLDPFIILSTIPFTFAGIIWMLFLSFTPLSVPALTGVIMCIGISTANSILVVSFAKQGMDQGKNAFNAIIDSATTRIRPVLMTALAMIIGMLPMALGLGEGGEQNAPLGRAVIGGLTFATVATLFFVPTLFYILHRNKLENNEVG